MTKIHDEEKASMKSTNKVQSLVLRAMSDSCHLIKKNQYFCDYFTKLSNDESNYPWILEEDIEIFTNEIRKQAKKFLQFNEKESDLI
jgi:hypothetical protein